MARRRRLLSDAIADLRLDLSDPEAILFNDATLLRCIKKAVFRAGQDLDMDLRIWRDRIVPSLEDNIYELVLILSQVHGCQVMRSATASAFSFASGDKRVDKTKQPEHWAKLEVDLRNDYNRRLVEMRPEVEINEEAYIITPSGLAPVIYEQGEDL